MPRAFTEQERERIKKRLIEAGKRAINRSGIKNLVVDDIAREAGISKGSFYSFFPSREEFILSVFEAWEAEHRSALIRQISEGGGSPRERLTRFFLEAIGMLERESGLSRLGFKEIERLIETLPPERIAAHKANDEQVLETTFAEWAQRGFIDPEVLDALGGIGALLFSVAIHKEDFPPGTFGPASRLLAEALAMRIAPDEAQGGESV